MSPILGNLAKIFECFDKIRINFIGTMFNLTSRLKLSIIFNVWYDKIWLLAFLTKLQTRKIVSTNSGNWNFTLKPDLQIVYYE